jgi:hypothetical protein
MKFGKLLKTSFLVVTLSAFIGCGSATNNDQGVTFTFLGFFSDSAGATGLSGTSVAYSDVTSEPGGFAADAISVLAFIGVQNNLSGQFIRLQRAYISYTIPGTNLLPPSTSQVLSGTLTPVDNAVGSSLPDPLKTGKNVKYIQIAVLPPQVRTWISLQRESLPEAPFDIEATVFAHGVTSAGDQVDTNEGGLRIRILPDDVIPPTVGTGDAAATSSEIL